MSTNIFNIGKVNTINNNDVTINTSSANAAEIIKAFLNDNAEDIQAEEVKPQQPKNKDDKNARAILAVHQAHLCDAAEWAVVVKLLEEQGAIPKSAYLNAATYINDICGQEVTNARAIARSVIYTKIIGKYPDWRIKEGEESREAPNKLSRFNKIAQVFIEEQNA